MYANHHKNEVKDYFKKQKILQGSKTNFFLQGPKLKRAIFAGTSAIFKPFFFLVRRDFFFIIKFFMVK